MAWSYRKQVELMFVGLTIAFIVIVGVVSILRLRRGGPGPAVNWVPRSMRGAVNRRYEARGRQQPYDADGNRNPSRGQI